MLIWFWQAMILDPLGQLNGMYPDALTEPDFRTALVGIAFGYAVLFWVVQAGLRGALQRTRKEGRSFLEGVRWIGSRK